MPCWKPSTVPQRWSSAALYNHFNTFSVLPNNHSFHVALTLMERKMAPIKMLCSFSSSTNLTSYSPLMKQLQDMLVEDNTGSLVSPPARYKGNGQRGATVWFNCNQMGREESGALWSLASGHNVAVLREELSKRDKNEAERRGCLFAAVWFTGQSASFQSEVRGHWSVTVVEIPAFPGTIGASPGHSMFTWQTWQRLYKPTVKTYSMHDLCMLRSSMHSHTAETVIYWLTFAVQIK